MKKLMVFLMAAMFAFACTTAVAESVRFVEDSSLFDIEMELPENATVGENTGMTGTNLVRVDSEGLASVWVVIAYSEIYTDNESMNDLDEEEIQNLMDIAGIQYEEPELSVDVTPSGNKYIRVCANSEFDIDSIFTLYKGYFVELTQWHDDYSELTDADLAFMQQLLYNIEFTELK